MNIFLDDLSVECDSFWMNDDEFLCKYRVTCDQLDRITNILTGDAVFAQPKRGYPQMPMKYQFMVWPHYV